MQNTEGSDIGLADAARELSLSWGQAWRLLLLGQLEGKKDGGRWRVTTTSIERLREQRLAGSPRRGGWTQGWKEGDRKR